MSKRAQPLGLAGHRPLRGMSVILSASVPTADRDPVFHGIPLDRAQIEVEQATVSIARAVFGAGGRIVCGGHPSITPILAVVSGEFSEIRAAEELVKERSEEEARLVVYQSKAYEDAIPRETRLLAELRQADVRMTDMEPEERGMSWEKGRPKYPKSILAMRRQMMLRPDVRAMICIGGMEGVLEEAEMFLETAPKHPLYVLVSTGGAAQILGGHKHAGLQSRVRVLDEDLLASLELGVRRSDDNEKLLHHAPPRLMPYAVVAHEIVRDLTTRHLQ